MRRLRGGVDHRADAGAEVLEQGVQRGAVANVEFMVTIAAQVPFQPVSVHPGACLGTEEARRMSLSIPTTCQSRLENRRAASDPTSPALPVTIRMGI